MNIDSVYKVFQTVSSIRTAHCDVSISLKIYQKRGWAYSRGGHNVKVIQLHATA